MTLAGNTSCNSSVADRYESEAALYGAFTVQRPLERALLPVWFLLGVPGSLASLVVWLHRRMRFSSSVYLAALALVDLSFLLFMVPWYLHEAWSVPVMHTPVFCELYPTVTYALQYASPLLTLAFTVERYISVCFPFQHEALCTPRRAKIVTALLLMASLSLSSLQAFFYQFDTTTRICGAREELHSSLQSTWLAWTWTTELAVFGLVPFAILLINCRVVVEMRRMNRRIPAGNASQASTRATTFMLVCVSTYLISATLPVTICYVLFFLFDKGAMCLNDEQLRADATWSSHFAVSNVRAFVDTFARSHYAAKFYIYMATGRQFRRQFLVMFCPKVGEGGQTPAAVMSDGLTYTAIPMSQRRRRPPASRSESNP